MTREQIENALRLYRKYQTETRAYHQIADELRIPITELNRRCWYLSRGQQYPGT
jgi:hypothetical protein